MTRRRVTGALAALVTAVTVILAPGATAAPVVRHGATVAPYAVRPVVVTPHRVVIASRVPHCTAEDASSGPVPCSWNFHRGHVDGNGTGLAYYVTGTHVRPTFHYVWPSSPVGNHPGYVNPWHWITPMQAHGLAQHHIPGARNRLWTACILRTGAREMVRCPDGTEYN